MAKQGVVMLQHILQCLDTMIEVTCNDRLGKKVRVKCKYPVMFDVNNMFTAGYRQIHSFLAAVNK